MNINTEVMTFIWCIINIQCLYGRLIPDSLTREEGFVVPLFKQPTMPLVSVGRTPLLSRTTPFFFAFYVINRAHMTLRNNTHITLALGIPPTILWLYKPCNTIVDHDIKHQSGKRHQ